ncbi:DNA mismatch endonuclease Vsr [Salmonella enterica subsp. enterica serovar Cerro]|nr:DNA mismatch endonuclease Vsr [Salmonella enterica]ECV2315614.1 very short patch repair endonuclease [Salmonella enterica subsp. enterica serovar Muenster]EHH5868386.1 DNA mismatch endonuclease Vsr [Salmonella enterica subsp. enterica serovar Kentucky]EJW6892207.1 DNA mismatch endonuclease Vsr [Escherichia coli]EKH2967564.1 DNA mismatch endonuclease Vsr [Salmonella enterica subsp. enterica serovar Cerro]
MVDTLTPEERSGRMSRVRARDTKPEMKLRRLIHGMGFRYRLHRRDLPGKPDLVFPGRRSIIFMHGCFWHRHEGCGLARLPKSKRAFWSAKLEANKERDQKNISTLEAAGWRVLVIWECQLRDEGGVREVVKEFLTNYKRENNNEIS